MNIIRFLLRNSKGGVILIIGVGIIGGISSASLIALIHASLSSSGYSRKILMLSYAGLCLLTLLSSIGSQVLLLRLSQASILDLRFRLCRNILQAPLRRLEEAGSPRLLAALAGDANTLSNALFSLPLLCINFATLVACMVYIAWLAWPLFLGLLVFMVCGMISYQIPIRKSMGYMKLSRKEMERLFTHFRALIDGNKELKLHRVRQDEFYVHDLEDSALNLQRHTVTGASINIIAESWGRLLYFVLIGLLIFAAPLLTQLDPQALTGYVLIVFYLMGPVGAILGIIPAFTGAQVALERLNELGLSLDTKQPDKQLSSPVVAKAGWHTLELSGVTHVYHRENEDSDFTLGPIDVSFHPGELVFLVGGNGSGKSTFAKILTGLYVPENGKISLDGQVVTDETRENYRQLFTAVFSDFFLFTRLPGATTTDLNLKAQEYLVQLQLNHKVQVEAGMISTPGLSYGQRKRLALLTAYLEDRPFFVFDEWASDQDPLFKNIFYTQLLPELKNRGKTILVISHDDRYYYVADRIIKLDYGQSINN